MQNPYSATNVFSSLYLQMGTHIHTEQLLKCSNLMVNKRQQIRGFIPVSQKRLSLSDCFLKRKKLLTSREDSLYFNGSFKNLCLSTMEWPEGLGAGR